MEDEKGLHWITHSGMHCLVANDEVLEWFTHYSGNLIEWKNRTFLTVESAKLAIQESRYTAVLDRLARA